MLYYIATLDTEGTLVPICKAYSAGDDLQLVIHFDAAGHQTYPGPGNSSTTVIARTYMRGGTTNCFYR